MKRLLFGVGALVATVTSAIGADILPRTYKAPPPAYSAPALIYNWTGFYIGGHVGGAFAGNDSLQGSTARFMGGVQGGFDYQFAPNWVGGLEAQYSWLNNNTTGVLLPGAAVITSKNDQIGSVTGRFGHTWGPALLYGKGGFAWRDNPNVAVAVAGAPATFATTGNNQEGWTVGAGLEYMFAPNWSAKAEYQYYNFGTTTFTAGPAAVIGSRFRDDEHSVKLGVNYRFGWGGPVQSRY